MVPRQGNATAEMPASLIASTWSLIILGNGDATTIPRSFFFVWVSLPRTTAKLNFSQNTWEELPQHPFAPVNPKQPGAALLWARICLKIMPNSGQAFHRLHSNQDNCGQNGYHKLVVWHPSQVHKSAALSVTSHDAMRAWWVVDMMMTG